MGKKIKKVLVLPLASRLIGHGWTCPPRTETVPQENSLFHAKM